MKVHLTFGHDRLSKFAHFLKIKIYSTFTDLECLNQISRELLSYLYLPSFDTFLGILFVKDLAVNHLEDQLCIINFLVIFFDFIFNRICSEMGY